jgi:hypothetical protein
MHYSTVAAALAFIPTLIAAQLGTAYPGHFERALYARNAYAFSDPNYGNDLTSHVKRAIEARYAEADALADAYAMAEAEAEAFPNADNVALLEGLYRRAAYAYPNAFAEPAKLTPEQCKAKVKSVTEPYQPAQEKYLYEAGQWGVTKPNKSQAMKHAETMLLWAKG